LPRALAHGEVPSPQSTSCAVTLPTPLASATPGGMLVS
jgi:hypothetical protein